MKSKHFYFSVVCYLLNRFSNVLWSLYFDLGRLFGVTRPD